MTAEIVIMNREAVALAADSAVSLMAGPGESPQKIFTSAEKIFELSREHAACIMVYNNAAFMGIPWQTLITMYRTTLPDTPFDTLEEYSKHFIGFLTGEEGLIPESVQQRFFVDGVYRTFLFIRYLVKTPFGLALQGIRDDPIRMRSLGYNVALHRTLAFGLGALIALRVAADFLDLLTLAWLLDTFLQPAVLILVILFQADIRRGLSRLGRGFFVRMSERQESPRAASPSSTQ